MSRKISAVLVSLFLLAILGAPIVHGQDDVPLILYGETVTGEITDRDFEIPYRFAGNEGDTVVIIMKAIDPLGDMNLPSIILLDAEFGLLGDTYGFGDARLVATLPADGEYNILATRSDGRAGDSVGEYSLSLLKPEVLVEGTEVTGTVTNEDTAYFVVEGLAKFQLVYEKIAGTFNPEVTVNAIEDYEFNDVAVLSGEYLAGGTIGIDSGIPEVFIVTVSEALWDFNFESVTAEYSLTLTE